MRERIVRRVARELQDGNYINVGISLPALVANCVPKERTSPFSRERQGWVWGPYATAADLSIQQLRHDRYQ